MIHLLLLFTVSLDLATATDGAGFNLTRNVPSAVAAGKPLDCKCETTTAPFGCHKYIFREFTPGCVRVCDECHQRQDLETELVGCSKCDVDYCATCVEARGIARTGERLSDECQICTAEKTNCGQWCSKCDHIICQDCWSRMVLKGCPYCNDGDGSMKINPETGNFLGSVMDVAMVKQSREFHAAGLDLQVFEHAFKTLDDRDVTYPPGLPEVVRRTAEIIEATPYDDLEVEARRTLTLWSTLAPESSEAQFVVAQLAKYAAQVLPREELRQLLSPKRDEVPEAEGAQSQPNAAAGPATTLPAAAPPAPTEDSRLRRLRRLNAAPAEDATLRAALLTEIRRGSASLRHRRAVLTRAQILHLFSD